MSLHFDEPPLSILKTLKRAVGLWAACFLTLLPYGIIFSLISLALQYLAGIFTAQLGAAHDAPAIDMILNFCFLLGLSFMSIFLVLSVAYQIKVFVDNLHLSFKEVIRKALTKVLPNFIAATLVALAFGTVSGILAVVLTFVLSSVHDWQSMAAQLWSAVWIFLSVIIYLAAAILLIRASLYSFAILFDDKKIVESIRYSVNLVRGWRNIAGTFLLLISIQMISLVASVSIPNLFLAHPLIHHAVYLVLVNFAFLWSVAAMVCWYWHLQKHRDAPMP